MCLSLAIHPQQAAAQSIPSGDICVTDDCSVEANSDMATNGTEIDAYSTIENFDEDVDAVAVEGDLFDNTSGTLLRNGDDEEEDYAEVDLSTSVHAPDEYELDTYTAVCLDDGEGGCDEEDGPPFGLIIDTDYPTVASINPTSITVGTSGTITVNGQDFIDQFGDRPTPFINNSGVTLSLGSISDTQASVNYSVESNASTGDFGLNLKGLFGNGEPATLAVGDPTPVVTSISPSVWYAGNSYTVTISGNNFGTNPTSSISAAPGVTYTQTAGSDTSITANVSVARNAPSTNPISVTVTSQGFGGGSGFFPGTPGGSASGSTTAQAVENIPAPTINLLNGTTNSPYAGQLISLSVSAPTGWTLASQNWSFGNASNVVGGYNASAASGAVVPAPATNTTDLHYYYIVPGATETISVTATYFLAGGGTSSSSPAAIQTFDVVGPTAAAGTCAFVCPVVSTVGIYPPGTAFNGLINAPGLEMGDAGGADGKGPAGIVFNAVAATPSSNPGSFQWVQLILSRKIQYLATPNVAPVINPPLALDNWYPYFSDMNNQDSTEDSPGIGLKTTNTTATGEASDSFRAQMYLMWDPALPAGCTIAKTNGATGVSSPSTCTNSIPVPLGSIDWGYSGCAINSLALQNNGTTWTLYCPPPPGDPVPPNPQFVQSSIFPIWSTNVKNYLP